MEKNLPRRPGECSNDRGFPLWLVGLCSLSNYLLFAILWGITAVILTKTNGGWDFIKHMNLVEGQPVSPAEVIYIWAPVIGVSCVLWMTLICYIVYLWGKFTGVRESL